MEGTSKFDSNWTPEPNTGCFMWCGTIAPNGYGIFHDAEENKRVLAHRYAFEKFYGVELPPRNSCKCIDHLCRNRWCVNPAHLELVSYSTNLTRSLLTQAGMNAAKLACLRGHEFTPANTYIGTGGRRVCRTCKTMHSKTRNEMKKARRRAAKEAHG